MGIFFNPKGDMNAALVMGAMELMKGEYECRKYRSSKE